MKGERLLLIAALVAALPLLEGCCHTSANVRMSQVTMSTADAYLPRCIDPEDVYGETARELVRRGFLVDRGSKGLNGKKSGTVVEAVVSGKPGEPRHYSVEAKNAAGQGRAAIAIEIGDAVLTELGLLR